MPNAIVKFLLPLLVVSVAIPESEAKRMGGGRSAGRKVQGVKKTAPPARSAQPVRPQPTPPAANRQPVPDERIAGRQAAPQQAPSAPTQALPNQAASPWGGMLGGALLGLGIGSMMSRDGNAANQSERQAQNSSGSSGDSGSEGSSGASGDYANTPAATQSAPEANRQTASVFRTFLPIGLLALIIFFTIRRMRRRNL